MKQVTYMQATTFEIESESPFSLHADGEVLASRSARFVKIGVEAAAVQVVGGTA
jgi:diacylglycerol kinase family enzyme